jgi:hypothetical protein
VETSFEVNVMAVSAIWRTSKWPARIAKDASHASTSQCRYLTDDPILMKGHPFFSSRSRRTDATERFVIRAMSNSSKQLSMVLLSSLMRTPELWLVATLSESTKWGFSETQVTGSVSEKMRKAETIQVCFPR